MCNWLASKRIERIAGALYHSSAEEHVGLVGRIFLAEDGSGTGKGLLSTRHDTPSAGSES
jgi:hypothetical protein